MAASKPELVVSLQSSKRAYRADQSQEVTFTLTNDSERDIRVLKWRTPFEGFKSDMFSVEVDGREVPYLGRVYKRAAPSPDDYITITAGEEVSRKVDLSEAYDIARSGVYTVRYKEDRVQAGTSAPKTLARQFVEPPRTAGVRVLSNTAIFTLLEDRPARTVDGIDIGVARQIRDLVQPGGVLAGPEHKAPTFSGCTASRQTDLTTALAEAVKYANNASLALSSANHCAHFTGRRYTEWFGAATTSRYATVSTQYANIASALSNQTVKFNCDCTDSSYAYVYPTKPYEIFLCNAFWTAPMTGTDSKAGTLVHEMSHFNVVASTDDHAYGQAACRTLATSNPDQAIDNADSHEYFAENNPALPMNAVAAPVNPMTPAWQNLPAGFTGGYDAVLNGSGQFAGKVYFFKGNKYIRYDWASDRADAGYPKNIADNWHNLPAGFTGSYDAAVNGQGPFAGKAYFFKGDKYIRYDWASDRADPGYPASIQANWHDLPTGFRDNFQAILNGNGPFAGKAYFFKGDKYIRYDWATDRTDQGYPVSVADFWYCMPSSFTSNFDDAVEGDKQWSNRGYFFKANNYVRYNWADDHAE
jgi:peptidyl-Lys metalloendopeptidase